MQTNGGHRLTFNEPPLTADSFTPQALVEVFFQLGCDGQTVIAELLLKLENREAIFWIKDAEASTGQQPDVENAEPDQVRPVSPRQFYREIEPSLVPVAGVD